MDRLRENAGAFATVFVVDEQGIMRAHSPEPRVVGQDFPPRDYYRGARESTGLYVSAPYVGAATREPTVAMAIPLRDGQGTLRVILVGALTLSRLCRPR